MRFWKSGAAEKDGAEIQNSSPPSYTKDPIGAVDFREKRTKSYLSPCVSEKSMAFESIYLELNAKRLGCQIEKPPVVTGQSGIVHRYSFLATCGDAKYGYDVYESVDVEAVLRTYIKQVDTGVSSCIVCTSGTITDDAKELSYLYGMKILSTEQIQSASPLEVLNLTSERPVLTR